MKKSLFFLIIPVIAGTIFYAANTGTVYGHAAGGTTIQGLSGSPYDGGDCTGCHSRYAILQAPATWVTSNVPAAGYTPGATYTITCKAVNTTSGHNSNFGFELTPQNQTTGAVIGTLGNIVTSGTGSTTIAGGEWITHTSASYTGTDSCKWSFTWTAPNPGVGAVNVYAVFNCGSGDNQSSGQIYQDSLHYIQNPSATGPTCGDHYATLPYSTSFENPWLLDSCNSGAGRIPDIHWKSSIGGTTPTDDDFWHRDDYTGSDWTTPTVGAYSPAASAGTYSARFHNDPPPAGSTGMLDLYVDLSPTGTKTISFDYIHDESSASPFAFDVLLSTDGGKTFPTTLKSITSTLVSTWTLESVTTIATSKTSVIRFMVTDKGTHDVGIDNLSVSTSPTGIDEIDNGIALNAYPNPFRQNVTVDYNLVKDGAVNLYVVDMAGRVTQVHSAENESAGQHTLTIDMGSLGLAKGIYILELKTEENESFFKLIAQ